MDPPRALLTGSRALWAPGKRRRGADRAALAGSRVQPVPGAGARAGCGPARHRARLPARPRGRAERRRAAAAPGSARGRGGDRLCDAFLRNKAAELEEQRTTVTELERRRLLEIL